MLRLSFLVLLFLFSFSSCDCFNTCSEEVRFTLVDKQTGQDLVFGPTAIYSKDSLQLISAFGAFYQRVISDSASKTLYLSLNTDTVLLKLSSTDIDTILVRHHAGEKSRCCPNGYATVAEVRYNGLLSDRNGTVYTLRK